ncbi:MAG: ABC transporter permease [Anaerolineaceae bacterium]
MSTGVNLKKSKSVLQVFTKLFDYPWFSAVLSLVILCLVILPVNKSFYRMDNLLDILRTASYSFMVAAPVTLLLVSADMDLSMGAVISLGGVVCGKCLAAGMPIPASIVIALLGGMLVGLLKSFIVVQFKLPAFIVTLGLSYVINGFIMGWTNGISVTGFPAEFKVLGQGHLTGRIYYSLIIAVLIGVACHIALTKTKFGRSVSAIGGNQNAAYLAGINVSKHRYIVHVLVSVAAAFTGVMYASRFSSALPSVGTGSEMLIIASTIIGGTSMFGGTGTIIGTAIGCILFSTITNGLILMRVSVNWQSLVFGTILIISIIIDKYRRKVGGN